MDNGELRVLQAYASGELSRTTAMERIGVVWYGDLLVRMNVAGLRVTEPSSADKLFQLFWRQPLNPIEVASVSDVLGPGFEAPQLLQADHEELRLLTAVSGEAFQVALGYEVVRPCAGICHSSPDHKGQQFRPRTTPASRHLRARPAATASGARQQSVVWAGNRPKPACWVAQKRPDGEPSLFLFRSSEAAARDLTHPASSCHWPQRHE